MEGEALAGAPGTFGETFRRTTLPIRLPAASQSDTMISMLRQTTHALVSEITCFRGSITTGYAYLGAEDAVTFDVALVLRPQELGVDSHEVTRFTRALRGTLAEVTQYYELVVMAGI